MTTRDSLTHCRNLLDAAEASLLKARDKFKQARQHAGLSTDGIFSDTIFVLRTTADRWAREAERGGADRRQQVILDALKAARNAEGSPFAHLSQAGAFSPNSRELAEKIIAAANKARGEK